MDGFLGTRAPFRADLTLVVIVILVIVAAFGYIRARRKRFSTHCPVMATAALLNWVPVLLVMVPTWLDVASGTRTLATGPFAGAPIFHGVLGAGTQLVMTYTVARMYWLKMIPASAKDSPSRCASAVRSRAKPTYCQVPGRLPRIPWKK